MKQTSGTLLSIDQVSMNFGGLHALSNVSFEVRQGEILGLIGPNGAGKTTLLNLIAGAFAPTSGRIRLGTEDIAGLKAEKINRKKVVRTFQGAEVFTHLTLRENVVVGGVSKSSLGFLDCLKNWGKVRSVSSRLEEQADKYLKQVGLADKADDPATSLPAGQQRLLGVARALATSPELMLLDEPGAGLNESEKVHLLEIIRQLNRDGITIILIEHDMEVIGQLSDRIVVLDQGHLIGVGTQQEIRRNQDVIDAYLGRSEPIHRDIDEADKPSENVILSVEDLSIRYDGVQALNGLSMRVREGEIVALVGANGAGKSSLLKAIARLVPISDGSIRYLDNDISGAATDEVVAKGISLTPEGRELFPSLSVEDNLKLGRYGDFSSSGGVAGLLFQNADRRAILNDRMDYCFELFPVLKERRTQAAGTLSGGQAQMLAISRSLMNSPKLLMLDEPSLGLAPQIVEQILEIILNLKQAGLTILLIEQNARAALQIADWGYILSNGNLVQSGAAAKLLADDEISEAYLGWTAAEKTGGRSLRVDIS